MQIDLAARRREFWFDAGVCLLLALLWRYVCQNGSARGFVPVQQVFMQFGDIRVGNRKARCLRVTPKALKKLWTGGLQCLNDIKIFSAACGTAAGLYILAEHKDRAPCLLGKLARDQPDDALWPVRLFAVDENNLFV